MSTEAIPCPWCPRRFLTPAAVRPHLRDVHPEWVEKLAAVQDLHTELQRLHGERLAARKVAHDSNHPIRCE